MKTSIFVLFFISCFGFTGFSQADAPEVLLRLDDNGMNHSVTKAIEQVAKTGISFSTSVLFVCPWYQEAVEILKKYPNISVGVHLALNSEWKYYRWGPVLGQAVPSLIDSNGYFLPSTDAFLKSNYKLDEVERELSAQIDRAMRSGLKIDYIDYHMGTAVARPELRAIIEKLAKKYNLGISGYFKENYQSPFAIPVETKKEQFLKMVEGAQKGKINLMVMHVAEATPEMNALIDMNNVEQRSETKPLVAMHRSAELNALLSKEFQDKVKNGAVRLITYKDVLKRQQN